METVRVYVRRTDEGKWRASFDNGMSIGDDLERLSDVDIAISVARKVYQEMTGERINVLRFFDVDVDSFGNTQF